MSRRWLHVLVTTLAALLHAAALAAPIQVTTFTTGELPFADDVILSTLGMEYPPLPAPYRVTLQSGFDPEHDTVFRNGRQLWIFGADIDVTVQIGTSRFERHGEGLTILDPYDNHRYAHEVSFFGPIGSMDVYFKNTFNGPPGSITGDVLAPRKLASSGPDAGSMDIDMFPANPDASGFWTLGGAADSATLTVLNPVPEPAHWAMLGVGLAFVAGVTRWRPLNSRLC
jgi:hypothetical protein